MQQSPSLPNSPQPERRSRIGHAAILPGLVLLLLWLVFLVEWAYGLELHRYGILPRELKGIPGIFFSPFLHGDAEHLFNNSLPLFVLGWAIMYFYPRVAGRVVLAAWLISGAWVWISARGNYHIGASGVVYGLAAFLFVSGLLRRQRTLMALSLLVVFLYGGLVWGVLPIVPRVSWESHLWGAVTGVLMAFLYRKVPPAVQDPVRPTFDDEEDEALGDGPVHPALQHSAPLRIVYHLDPGDEADDAELAVRRQHAAQTRDFGPDNTSGTWDEGTPPY